MNHGSMNHGSMNHGSMNPGSRILDPGSRIQDPGPRTIQKIQKIGKCHEMDKYQTKSDEIWSIWSQTGQGNLFRGVPDPKKIQKRSKSLLIWAQGPFLVFVRINTLLPPAS